MYAAQPAFSGLSPRTRALLDPNMTQRAEACVCAEVDKGPRFTGDALASRALSLILG